MKLSNENYEIWRILEEAVFLRRNVHDVATGLTPIPATGPNSKGVKDWKRKDDEARAELILSVEPDQLAHMNAPTAYEIWQELERVHRARGFATKMSLRRTFMTMQKRDDQKMSSWIGDVRNVAFRLQKAGVSTDDEDIILVLTMGLPSTFDAFVVALDATDSNKLTLNDVIIRLLNEESRTDVSASSAGIESAFRAGVRRPKSEVTCFKCQKKGHYQNECKEEAAAHTAVETEFDAAW